MIISSKKTHQNAFILTVLSKGVYRFEVMPVDYLFGLKKTAVGSSRQVIREIEHHQCLPGEADAWADFRASCISTIYREEERHAAENYH